MTSREAPKFVLTELNHFNDYGDDDDDGGDESSTGIHRYSVSKKGGTNRTAENTNEITTDGRPAIASTKRVTWKQTGHGNGEAAETTGTTIHSTNGTPEADGVLNCEHMSASQPSVGSDSASSPQQQQQQQHLHGSRPPRDGAQQHDEQKTPTTTAQDRPGKGSPVVGGGVDRVCRSLDRILGDADPDAAPLQGVERACESIPSRRPVSLSVSKEMIHHQQQHQHQQHQQSAVSSTPASPSLLQCSTDAVSPVRQQHLTAAAGTSSVEEEVMESPVATADVTADASFRPVEPHFVVVAIDFGTTMSGYAFSFVRDPSSIHMMRKWEGGDPGVINQKTPTTLLLNPDGEFHSFGFAARDLYHDLDAKEAKRWFYFEKFKMALHYHSKLNKETAISASNGKAFPALKVFSYALKYFKEHALQELSDQSSTEILNDDIRWVITVPAIWKAPAKQFMRQAAYDAGIGSVDRPGQLLIALEPEAASIYVRRLRVHQLLSSDPPASPSSPPPPLRSDDASPSLSPSLSSSSPSPVPAIGQKANAENRIETLQANLRLFDSLPRQQTVGMEINDEGTRYMVVDCGGGTVDITVHEMEAKYGYLHELYKATGGPFGSVGVDLAFESLLVQIFGTEFIETFKTKRPAGWVDLMIAFESRKRAANPLKNNPLNVSLPFSFIEYYKKTKGSPVDSAIGKHGDPNIRWSSQGMLRLSPEAMRRLFRSTLDHIKQAIGEVLNTIKDIKYLFLVGGFAESPVLQHEIRHEFSHILKILIPQDVALTILKGAVCFGLDPTVVTIRRSRLTYGVEVLNRFDPERHPKSKRVHRDGGSWCTDVFDVFVTADQPMALGDTVMRKYAPAKPGQKTVNINVYGSEKTDVRFVTDPGVSKCGTLRLYLTDVSEVAGGGGGCSAAAPSSSSKVREIQALMTFGDTEIKVDAVDVTTGTIVGATIDFLSK